MPPLWSATHIVFLALVSLTIVMLIGGEMVETMRRRAIARMRSIRRMQRRSTL